jgi:hypothetical protein
MAATTYPRRPSPLAAPCPLRTSTTPGPDSAQRWSEVRAGRGVGSSLPAAFPLSHMRPVATNPRRGCWQHTFAAAFLGCWHAVRGTVHSWGASGAAAVIPPSHTAPQAVSKALRACASHCVMLASGCRLAVRVWPGGNHPGASGGREREGATLPHQFSLAPSQNWHMPPGPPPEGLLT